jgi:hypothetical protein
MNSIAALNSTPRQDFKNEVLTVPSNYEEQNIPDISFKHLSKPETSIKTKIRQLVNMQNEDSCDNIILKDGNEISGKVTEIGLNEIRYKKCTNLNGPTVVLDKTKVLMIKYPNGTKDIVGTTTVEKETTEPEEYRNNGASRVFGWVFMIVGILIFLFASILGGAVLMGLGLLLLILSAGKSG